MLGVEALDYRQLGKILALVRLQAGMEVPGKRWSWFSFEDLVAAREAIRVAVTLSGDRTQVERFAIAKLTRACRKLLAQGLDRPLLRAHLELQGERIQATLGSVTFDVMTGQLTLQAEERAPVTLQRLISRDPAFQDRLDDAWHSYIHNHGAEDHAAR